MLSRKLFSTTAFRFALVYLLLFGASVSLLLGYVYWSTVGFLTGRTDEAVVSELEVFVDGYRSTGLGSLIRSVNQRSRHPGDNIYLLIAPGGRFLAGTINVRAFPSEAGDNWIEFEHLRPREDGEEVILARARGVNLPGGFYLLVGRNVKDQREVENLVTRALAWSLGLTVLLGLAGGIVVGRNMLRRIDAVNWSIRDIMGGDFSRRLPTQGIGDELDRLSGNVNTMLDRIEMLMQGLREVGDNIAHDLRSPLNRMRNRIEIGLMARGSEAEVSCERERALCDAIIEVDELLRLFDTMLSIARLEARVEEDHWERLDIATIARELGELYAPVAEEQRGMLVFDLAPCLEIRGARELLARAVSNLIENAIAYGAAKDNGEGRIEIRGWREGEVVFLSVRDWGGGVPKEDTERVFNRFVRLESSRTRSGSGLGLSLVRAVARRHGGDAWMEDADPGCRVILQLPAAASAKIRMVPRLDRDSA